MDRKWLIIGGIVLLVLIGLGRNPISEHRKQRELEKQGKDPLIEAIQEFNHGGRRGMGSGGTRIMRPGRTDGESVAPPPTGDFSSSNSNIPNYMLRNRNYNNYN